MTITCPHCNTSGQLDDSKRPEGATSIKCPRCSQSFPLPPIASEPPPIESATPPPLPVAEPVQPAASICHVCKGSFSLNEMVRFGDNLVCAGCKPTYVQMLSMGMVGSGNSAAIGTLSKEQLLARDYSVDIGNSISSGWQMLKSNLGIVVGASILVYMSMMICSMVPFIGSIISLVLTGPFMGGLWMFYLKKTRNENASVNDAFCGFSSNFVQLMLSGIVTTLLSWLVMLVAILPLIFAVGTNGLFKHGTSAPAPSMALLIPAGLILLVGLAGFTYLAVCWLFAIPLVIDKRMPFWPAIQFSRQMVHKQWWMTFLLITVLSFVAMLGVLALFFGILITGPLAFAAIVAHYQAVFGELRAEA